MTTNDNKWQHGIYDCDTIDFYMFYKFYYICYIYDSYVQKSGYTYIDIHSLYDF